MNYLETAKRFLKKRAVLYVALLVVVDILFFTTTDPGKVAAPWLIVGYILAVATLYWIVRAIVAFLGLYSKALRRQKRRLATLLTLIGAILLAMDTVGQLSFRDLAVLVPLALIAYFYLSYGKSKKKA